MSGQKTLLLLDAHALIHRAYHALPQFRSKSGEPTGALYGLSAMVLRAIKELKPDYVVAAFDLPGPTFRHVAYEAYKAKRPKADDELVAQLQRAHDVVRAFGIPEISSPGFEADDMLGVIVEKTKKEKNLKVIIVSGDIDTFQLIDGGRVVVYTMRKGIEDTILYDENKVKERFGFGPESLPDYKGLRGDASDNIVGVPGIGEKTATELVKHFGALENLYNTIEKKNFKPPAFLKPRIADLLRIHKEDAFFSKTLATIRRDAEVEFHLPKERFELNKDALRQIYSELGFTSLIKRLDENQMEQKSETEESRSEQLTLYKKKLRILAESARGNEKDFWNDVKNAQIISFLQKDSEFRIAGKTHQWVFEKSFFQTSRNEWEKLCRNKEFIFWNGKEIIKCFLNTEIQPPARFFDCGVAAWVADSTLKAATFWETASLFLRRDVSDDTGFLLQTMPEIKSTIEAELKRKNVARVWEEIERPLISVLAAMELIGVNIDRKFLESFRHEIKEKLKKYEKEIHRLAGEHFNISSPQQVAHVLFEKLKIGSKKTRKTATGKLSTRESELMKLKSEHPIISEIFMYRELAKLLTTYIEPFFKMSAGDGKIHTTFNQTGTVTGRLSSESPNLQNIPVRGADGAKIRSAFVASRGYTFAALDYSQVELKILASLSQDEKMITAFNKGIDVHRLTAAEINNISINDVTPQMRGAAKTINFGIIFGMGIKQLSQSTGMSLENARKFYEEYFRDFPKIKEYVERIRKAVRRDGYVSTLYGRKRFFDLRNVSGNRFLESEIERMAINAIIQGTDADIMKRAMLAVSNAFDCDIVKPILQIHDEMIYEIKDSVLDEAAPRICNIMETVEQLAASLSVDVKIGKNLGALVSYRAGK